MGNLLASLTNAAESLRTFERALSVTANNVSNATTPGYVRQQILLVAQRLQLDAGLAGGVRAGGLQSARNNFLELAVRRQSQQASGADQRASLLEQIEPIFDVRAGTGVAGAIDQFQSAVSQWTIGPNDYPARQNVLRAAGDVAHIFRTTSRSLQRAGQGTDAEIVAAVTAVNGLGQTVARLNLEIRSDARAQSDPGIDAQIHGALEELSQYSDFTALRADDGTYSVYLGGQTPLVLGLRANSIAADFSAPQPALRDEDGRDITGQFSSGKLEALVVYRAEFLPGVIADLNRLARSFADQVNIALAAGLDTAGQPAAQPLFSYGLGDEAATLALTSITPDQLGAASVGAPGGNGNALALVEMLGSRTIDNFTFAEFFGEVAGRVGRGIALAKDEQQTQHQLLSQAKSVREERSAISLDEEAANLIQFQRSYEAAARMIRTLDELTETLLNI